MSARSYPGQPEETELNLADRPREGEPTERATVRIQQHTSGSLSMELGDLEVAAEFDSTGHQTAAAVAYSIVIFVALMTFSGVGFVCARLGSPLALTLTLALSAGVAVAAVGTQRCGLRARARPVTQRARVHQQPTPGSKSAHPH